MALTAEQKKEAENIVEAITKDVIKNIDEKILPDEKIESYMQELLLAHVAGNEESLPQVHPALQSGHPIEKITDKPLLIENLRKVKLQINGQNSVHVIKTQKQIGKLILWLGVTAPNTIELFLEHVEKDKLLKVTQDNQTPFMSVLPNVEFKGLLEKNKEYKILELDKNSKTITIDVPEIKEADTTPEQLSQPAKFSVSFYPYRVYANTREAWFYLPYKIPANVVTETNLAPELKAKINAVATEDILSPELKEKINALVKKEKLDPTLQAEIDNILPSAKTYVDGKINNVPDWMQTETAPSAFAAAEKIRTTKEELEQQINLPVEKIRLAPSLQVEINNILPSAKNYTDGKINNAPSWTETETAPSAFAAAEKIRTTKEELETKISKPVKKENLDVTLKTEIEKILPDAKAYTDGKINNAPAWTETETAPSAFAAAEKIRTTKEELESKIAEPVKKENLDVTLKTEIEKILPDAKAYTDGKINALPTTQIFNVEDQAKLKTLSVNVGDFAILKEVGQTKQITFLCTGTNATGEKEFIKIAEIDSS